MSDSVLASKSIDTHDLKRKNVLFVFIQNQHGEPLMPCSPAKARRLLNDGKAKVLRKTPFTLKLLYGSSGYKQPVVAGMDAGTQTLGCAAVANGQVVYQSEVKLRSDVSKKMQQRAVYRRNRRGRKTRYRKARWRNRASMRKKGRIAPSVRSKIESHLREKKQVESILPITLWKVETASFDIHRLTNPDVSSLGYQEGAQKGHYNVKAYVLDRDGYRCQSGRKVEHDKVLQVHHKVYRSQGGTNAPDNLVTICRKCHEDLHAGMFELKARKSKTKHATEMGIVKSQLKKRWRFEETYGYETKYKREQCLGLSKSHANDAVAICCEEGETVKLDEVLYLKRHVSAGDYQQTMGRHSQTRLPTGKLFGLRKHDLVRTETYTGWVKGKRSTGFFALETIDGQTLTTSVNVKKATTRLAARTTTLTTQRKGGASSPL